MNVFFCMFENVNVYLLFCDQIYLNFPDEFYRISLILKGENNCFFLEKDKAEFSFHQKPEIKIESDTINFSHEANPYHSEKVKAEKSSKPYGVSHEKHSPTIMELQKKIFILNNEIQKSVIMKIFFECIIRSHEDEIVFLMERKHSLTKTIYRNLRNVENEKSIVDLEIYNKKIEYFLWRINCCQTDIKKFEESIEKMKEEIFIHENNIRVINSNSN